MNKIKIIATLPIFLWVYIQINWKYRKKNLKKKVIDESKYYFWIKKYAKYLLWIYDGKNKKDNFLIDWNEKTNFLIINEWNPVFYLAILKINDFKKKHSPITFIFLEKQIKFIPKIIWKFCTLINYFVIKENNKTDFNKIVQNLKIPRTGIILLDSERIKNFNWIKIPYGSYADCLLIETIKEKKKFSFNTYKFIKAKELIQLNQKFLIKQILKENK